MFAAYLTNTRDNHNKHYFLGVWARIEDDQWVVGTAWGSRGALYQQEKIYEGGKKGPRFPNEQAATAYAVAIMNSKARENYGLEWKGFDMAWAHTTLDTEITKQAPRWFQELALGHKPKKSTPASTAERLKQLKEENDDLERELTPPNPRVPTLTELKARFNAKKLEQPRKKEEVPFGFKPRFARIPKKV